MRRSYKKLIARQCVAFIQLANYDRGAIISNIYVNEQWRGRGFARELLKQVIEAADREYRTLKLAVAPKGGMNAVELEAWYKRNGFVWKNALMMVRRPTVRRYDDERCEQTTQCDRPAADSGAVLLQQQPTGEGRLGDEQGVATARRVAKA